MNSLTEAIEWTRDRWDQQRPVPLRLHEAHTTEGALGAPRFTGAFRAALDGRADAVDDSIRTETCYHPLLSRGMSPRDCPECYGVNVKDVRVDRYRYPMSLALARLSKVLRQRRHPHPVTVVQALAEHGWDAHAVARSFDMHWDLAEPLLLRALRQLHARYQEGPIGKVGWVSKSEAQQNAEVWTAA